MKTMRDLLRRDRKGVSIMIGYVLLIVIAVSMAIAVYSYLKLYLPKDQLQCSNDIAVTIDEDVCSGQEVNITIRNRGLFNVQGVFVRIGEQDRVYRDLLSQELFINIGGILKPGEQFNGSYSYGYTSPAIRELEIQPFIFVKNESAICERAVVKKIVNCV